MRKKRKSSRDELPQRRRRSATKGARADASLMAGNAILIFLARRGGEPASLAEIREALEQHLSGRGEIDEALNELLRREDIVAAGKKRFRLNPSSIFCGRVEKNPRGFGFVTDLEPKEKAQFFEKDPFLSVRAIGSANHGDRVLIRVARVRRDGRPEAEVIAVLDRFAETITGFYKTGNPPRVIPEDVRYPSTIAIADAGAQDAADNDVVIVQILPGTAEGGNVRGRIVEVLGSAQNIDVQMRIVIERFNLPHIFSQEALQEAGTLSFTAADAEGRLDLRRIGHVTIDGETAKDFDDAVAVEKTADGFRLYVSIADVSHFVRPGGALDQEAYLRGTSIYFPGRVIPMLPERLSNNLCSLVPYEDRLTFSAILDFSQDGRLMARRFAKSIICSRQRFTYTTVKRILIDRDAEVRRQYEEFLVPLEWARELAEALLSRRMARGSIGFNIPEADVSLEENGRIQSINRMERNFAHQIIEEFMLAANEAVAALFSERHLPFIYRIHERPDPEKVEEFRSFAASLGITLPLASSDPEWFAKVLKSVSDTPKEYVINNLLLRAMQQARYSPVNAGHFGLAAGDYTHFTSPIRRYPDLMVHRFLDDLLQKRKTTFAEGQSSLREQADHLSARERLAVSAERDITDRLKIFFMEQFIGQTFKAVISGVTENVLFVELIDLFVNGSIDISTLTDDYYLYDSKRYRLIGEISGRSYQLGATLEVMLLDVDHRRKRINFAPSGKA